MSATSPLRSTVLGPMVARLILALVLCVPIAAGLARPLPVERLGMGEPAIWSAPSGPSPVPDRPDDPDAPARTSARGGYYELPFAAWCLLGVDRLVGLGARATDVPGPVAKSWQRLLVRRHLVVSLPWRQ